MQVKCECNLSVVVLLSFFPWLICKERSWVCLLWSPKTVPFSKKRKEWNGMLTQRSGMENVNKQGFVIITSE